VISAAPDWIVPHWPVPARVRALVTTRAGGVSPRPYASMNLGLRSGDAPENVLRNRALLRQALPAEPKWLRQVHGCGVVRADQVQGEVEADAAVTREPATVCVVMAADCMPVLLCDRGASVVGVAHAGWRGLSGGVVEQVVQAMEVPAAQLITWLGPCIGPARFEVGDDVLQAFTAGDPGAAAAFAAYPGRAGKWLCDLYALARRRLHALGVAAVYGGGFCTVNDPRFYSHRRDQGASGRMAALIWLE
jgi:YfiH family protein